MTKGVTPRPRSGQWPRGDTPRPKPEARGSGREELPHAPKPEARGDGWEELSHAPKPEAKGSGGEEQPQVQGALAARAQEGREELSHIEGQKGGGEEISFVQGKEQRLSFAGAAVKRYPTPKVRETQIRR